MAKSKHINLMQDGVISQEALVAYAAGQLSPAEVVEVDKLLQNDDFAREALDGIRQASGSSQMATAVSTINTRLIEKTGAHLRQQKSAKIHWSVYAYAALILGVLIGVGFVMIHIYSGRSADADINKGIVQGQQSMPVAEPKKEEPKPDTALLAAQLRDSLARANTADTASLAMNDTIDTARAAGPAVAKSTEIAMNKPAEPAMVEKKSLAVTKPAEAKAPMMLSRTQASDPATAQLSAAMTFFESGDYANAERKYNEILASQPGNVDALYFGGVSSFINGSKGFGEANFDKLLKSGYYPEGTTWYKANILIRKGQKDQAKELLRSLINSNSSFKDRAIKKYEELWEAPKK